MTDNIKNICIIGAGNVGIALAVDITQKKEFNVRILTSRAQDLPVVYEKNDIDKNIKLTSNNLKVTNDYNEALEDIDLIFITVPSFMIECVISKIKLEKPAIIVFVPGYGSKDLYCKKFIDQKCIIAGFDRSPYVARLSNPSNVVASNKKQIRIASLQSERTNALARLMH